MLQSLNKKVSVSSFPKDQLEKATEEYAKVESRAINRDKIEAVLVSVGPIETLRRAYAKLLAKHQSFYRLIQRIITEYQEILEIILMDAPQHPHPPIPARHHHKLKG